MYTLIRSVMLAQIIGLLVVPVALANGLRDFVMGNTLFILYHEMGHGLISLYDLPVLGKEEDAADRFAAVWLADMIDDAGRDNIILQDLLQAAEGWFLMAKQQQKNLVPEDLYAEHGLDAQRYYSLMCLLYGAHADRLSYLPQQVGLDQERAERCIGEFNLLATDWYRVLDPYNSGWVSGQCTLWYCAQ